MKTKGFTLIELMVAISLFGLIASGAMMLVITGVRMQTRSARVDVAQSAARTGLDFLTRDLLSASAGASAGIITINIVSQMAVSLIGTSNSGYNGSDELDIWEADTTSGYATVYSNTTTGTTSLTVDVTSPFLVGQNALVSNLTNAAAFTIGSLTPPAGSTAGTIGVNTGGTYSFTSGTGGVTFTAMSGSGVFVFPLRHVSYKVDHPFATDSTYINNDYLMINLNDGNGWQPLAEGIEDLQVAFGYDTNGDGILTDSSSTTDEWFGNVAGDNITGTMTVANAAILKSVRVTIVAKSTSPEGGVLGAPPVAEDHTPTTTQDNFFRRLIRTEVTLRNLNI